MNIHKNISEVVIVKLRSSAYKLIKLLLPSVYIIETRLLRYNLFQGLHGCTFFFLKKNTLKIGDPTNDGFVKLDMFPTLKASPKKKY